MLAEISDAEFRQLRDLIRARFGIFYDDSKHFLLQSRLQTRLLKCSVANFEAYCRFLRTHPDRENEWDELASVLSNNETYFFREHAQLEVLGSDVVSEALHNGGTLRVWSSACSTGEEAFSLAMTLADTGKMPPDRFHIMASDLSPRALERCNSGFYRDLSFRATPPELIRRYFRPCDGGYVIADQVKRLVNFFRINLLDEQLVARQGPLDAIFCRNVLIYFDKPTQKRVVESLARALRPRGYLFLGHAESIMRLTDLFEPVVTPKAIYYRLQNNAS